MEKKDPKELEELALALSTELEKIAEKKSKRLREIERATDKILTPKAFLLLLGLPVSCIPVGLLGQLFGMFDACTFFIISSVIVFFIAIFLHSRAFDKKFVAEALKRGMSKSEAASALDEVNRRRYSGSSSSSHSSSSSNSSSGSSISSRMSNPSSSIYMR